MRFEWDDGKNRANIRNHGIGFDSASRVFDDPFCVTKLDRVASGEQRWQTVGAV